jgi:hypothetical protein
MIEALKGTHAALDGLFDSKMVRGSKMMVVRAHLSTDAWQKGTTWRGIFLFVCGVLVPALMAYAEWYNNNWKRLRQGTCVGCDQSDYDWGLTAIMPATKGLLSARANAYFDFAAFTCEGLLIGSAVIFFLYMADVTEIIPVSGGRVRGHLLPDLRSNDKRRGFQMFEEPLQYMLSAALTFYLICYSIRINRIYMRTQGSDNNILEFIKRELSGQSSGFSGFVRNQFSGALFEVPTPGRQDFFADTALLLVSFFALLVVIRTVGTAARRAKATAAFHYERQDSESLFGLSVEDEKQRLETMSTWPLEWKYLKLNWLVIEILVALISLWFYRIGLYLAAVIVVALIKRIKREIDMQTKGANG